MTRQSKKLWILLLLPCLSSLAGESLYKFPFKFRSDQGEVVTLDKFRGSTVVITMAFTSCKASCPLIVKKLREVQAHYRSQKKDHKIVIVSFDTDGDTPEVMRTFKSKMGADLKDWTFLVGSEKDTRTLGNIMGFRYSHNPESKMIMHNNRILVLDHQGAIIPEMTLEGLTADIAKLR